MGDRLNKMKSTKRREGNKGDETPTILKYIEYV